MKKTMIAVIVIALMSTAGLAMAQGWGSGSGRGTGYGPNMNGYGPGFDRPFVSDRAVNHLTPGKRVQWQASRGNFHRFGPGFATHRGGFNRGRGMAAGYSVCPRW